LLGFVLGLVASYALINLVASRHTALVVIVTVIGGLITVGVFRSLIDAVCAFIWRNAWIDEISQPVAGADNQR
jgi:hypothetical protein